MSLLINEPPLQVLPSLAILIGLNEAIVLQQLHYLLPMAQTVHDGKKWVYNSFEDWQGQHFPFFSVDTVKRAFNSLRQKGLILCEKLQKQQRNQTNFYTINYDELNKLCSNNANSQLQNSVKNKQKTQGKMHQSISANCIDGQGQIASMSSGQIASMLQENTNRIHTRECEHQNSSDDLNKNSSLSTDEKTHSKSFDILGEKLNLKQLQDTISMKLGSQRAEEILKRPDFEFLIFGFNSHYDSKPVMSSGQKYYRLAQWLISDFEKSPTIFEQPVQPAAEKPIANLDRKPKGFLS